MTGHIADGEQNRSIGKLVIAPKIAAADACRLEITVESDGAAFGISGWRQQCGLNRSRDIYLFFEHGFLLGFVQEFLNAIGHGIELLAELSDFVAGFHITAHRQIAACNLAGGFRQLFDIARNEQRLHATDDETNHNGDQRQPKGSGKCIIFADFAILLNFLNFSDEPVDGIADEQISLNFV